MIKIKIFKFLNKTLNKIRTFYWRIFFGRLSSKSRVLGRVKVYSPENIFLGKFSSINEGVLLNAREKIKIGDYVHISPFCIINTGGLNYQLKKEKRKHIAKEIIIEDGVWIGSGAIINPGVKIGENSVIGAGAVVSKDIPANVIAVGVPAKIIKKIT